MIKGIRKQVTSVICHFDFYLDELILEAMLWAFLFSQKEILIDTFWFLNQILVVIILKNCFAYTLITFQAGL